MIKGLPCLHVARLKLETTSGLSIGSGQSDAANDVALVRDANGLPTIPGTSLAGVLRHLYEKQFGTETTNKLFGTAEKKSETPSQLQVSWGMVHDSQDRAVEGLLLDEIDERLKADRLLHLLALSQPVHRDHVRLDHRGSAADQGKFDRAAVPPGCRFSVELLLWSDKLADKRWQQLLSLLNHPGFRLGGATRRGYGGIKVERCCTGQFDLRQKEDWEGFAKLSRRLDEVAGLTVVQPPPSVNNNCISAKLELKPVDFWRFGQGTAPVFSKEKEHPPDLLPVVTPHIRWPQGRLAEVVSHLLIPASAIKGALAHRFLFHLHRSLGKFVQQDENRSGEKPSELPEFITLFGEVNEDEKRAQAGRLFLEDLCLPLPEEKSGAMLMHNAIDRFTGGVLDGALFAEEMVFDLPLNLNLVVNDPPDDAHIRQALQWTLADLTCQRLALGAGSSRGHGYFQGKITWSDHGQWIHGGEQS